MKKIIAFLIIVFSLINYIHCYANIAEGLDGSCTWVIDDNGALTISPGFGKSGTISSKGPWRDYREKITSIKLNGTINCKDCSYLFDNFSKVKNIDLGDINTDGCDDMSYMFSGCKSLEEVDVSNLNTENVIYMNDMFANCISLKHLDVSTFNVWKVVKTGRMFYNCQSLEELDLSRWFTYNVAEMQYMFYNCKKLKYLDIKKWDFRGTLNMESTFVNCESLQNINLEYFNLYRTGTLKNAFKNCHSLESLNLTGIYDICPESIGTFIGCENLKVFYSYSDPEYWNIEPDIFKSIPDTKKIILYVPREYLDDYKKSPNWSIFDVRAIEDESTNQDNKDDSGSTYINSIIANKQSATIHSINGASLQSPCKGINIINGKKYLVK